MKEKLAIFFTAIWSVFAPIQLCVIILMFVIFVDTIVKLISLKKIAQQENKKYKDVFKSKILRKRYVLKAAGYYVIAIAVFPLDYYALTPFSNGLIHALGYTFTLPTTAVYTNTLLCLFCLMELSSINENWFDISGNNMLKSAYTIVGKIKESIEKVSETYKNIKN